MGDALLGRQGGRFRQSTLENTGVFGDELRVESAARLAVCLCKNGLRSAQGKLPFCCDGFSNVAESLTHLRGIFCFFACVETALGVDPPGFMHAASRAHTGHVINGMVAAQKGSAFVTATAEGTGLTMSKDAVGQGVCEAGNSPKITICGIFHAPSYIVLVTKLDEIGQRFVYGIGGS